MFNKWRQSLLKKKRTKYPVMDFTEEEQTNHQKEKQEQKEWYLKWEDLKLKEDIKSLCLLNEYVAVETFLQEIKESNRKWYWRHPFSSIWTDIYIKWFNWFYLIPPDESVGIISNEQFKEKMIALFTKEIME